LTHQHFRSPRSSHGVLRTTLHACIATNKMVDQPGGQTRQIHTPTFEGTIPGPTLSVEPGDRLSILLSNDLPANPKEQRKGAFPHDQFTLNLHTHGLEVSPLSISDNIFRQMAPGTAHQIKVDIPKDHPTETFWYHPHKHGSVTFQFLGGMAGFLIIKGGPGTLDAVPEIAAAKDIVMSFQVIRTALDGNLVFVNQQAEQFGTFPFPPPPPPITKQGIWSTYGLDGAPGRSFFYYTTNGVTNPTLHMRPGEVQRWRLLNASDGDNLLVALRDHGLNIVAMDGITVDNMYQLQPGDPVVMGPGQRMDVLVKAGNPGTYLLQTLDPGTDNIAGEKCCSVSPSGIDPAPRNSRHSFDFPTPCATNDLECKAQLPKILSYPVTLATVVVDDGPPLEMNLPVDPLPVPKSLPSVATMLKKTPDAVRHVAFEICGNVPGTSMDPKIHPDAVLPSCGWYFAKYNANYWGNAPFNDLLMMRDADDKGKPTNNPHMPLVDFKKEGLFDPSEPLFTDMIAGNYEEWTVINRSFSDHPFHIHQNPVLVTKINGITLPKPEWHDTLIVPAAIPQPGGPLPVVNINKSKFGSITFRTHFGPVTVGCFVMHCHTLNHEDIGMMQRVDILPGQGKPSGCVPEVHSALPKIERRLARQGKFPFRGMLRQSKPVTDGSRPLASNRIAHGQ
jgi:FtsP/CotA-like multicopper oxidase with cupredoxin domain